MLVWHDSGSAPTLANHAKHFPGATLRTSQAQKNGVKYVVASGGELANEGEFEVLYQNVDRSVDTTVFQTAAVGMPIFSISKYTEGDFEVTFRKKWWHCTQYKDWEILRICQSFRCLLH